MLAAFAALGGGEARDAGAGAAPPGAVGRGGAAARQQRAALAAPVQRCRRGTEDVASPPAVVLLDTIGELAGALPPRRRLLRRRHARRHRRPQPARAGALRACRSPSARRWRTSATWPRSSTRRPRGAAWLAPTSSPPSGASGWRRRRPARALGERALAGRGGQPRRAGAHARRAGAGAGTPRGRRCGAVRRGRRARTGRGGKDDDSGGDAGTRPRTPVIAPPPSRSPWQRLYAAAHRRRAAHWRAHAERLPVPVWSVGNLHWGGTGKTPVVTAIAGWLHERGVAVAVLSRGYGRRGSGAVVVSARHWSADDARARRRRAVAAGGDAAGGTGRGSGTACRRGAAAARHAAVAPQLFLLDDGFSHLRLRARPRPAGAAGRATLSAAAAWRRAVDCASRSPPRRARTRCCSPARRRRPSAPREVGDALAATASPAPRSRARRRRRCRARSTRPKMPAGRAPPG